MSLSKSDLLSPKDTITSKRKLHTYANFRFFRLWTAIKETLVRLVKDSILHLGFLAVAGDVMVEPIPKSNFTGTQTTKAQTCRDMDRNRPRGWLVQGWIEHAERLPV